MSSEVAPRSDRPYLRALDASEKTPNSWTSPAQYIFVGALTTIVLLGLATIAVMGEKAGGMDKLWSTTPGKIVPLVLAGSAGLAAFGVITVSIIAHKNKPKAEEGNEDQPSSDPLTRTYIIADPNNARTTRLSVDTLK